MSHTSDPITDPDALEHPHPELDTDSGGPGISNTQIPAPAFFLETQRLKPTQFRLRETGDYLFFIKPSSKEAVFRGVKLSIFAKNGDADDTFETHTPVSESVALALADGLDKAATAVDSDTESDTTASITDQLLQDADNLQPIGEYSWTDPGDESSDEFRYDRPSIHYYDKFFFREAGFAGASPTEISISVVTNDSAVGIQVEMDVADDPLNVQLYWQLSGDEAAMHAEAIPKICDISTYERERYEAKLRKWEESSSSVSPLGRAKKFLLDQ